LSLDPKLPQDWVARIYGGGDEDYISDLRTQISNANLENRIEFKGQVSQSEIAIQMGRSMAFIHSALWDEPFGRVTMEAMAYGAPLISADSGAVYEIPTDKCALIYDRFDPTALADKMRLVIENPKLAKRYVEAGLTRYDECFRPELEAQRMQSVIEEVLLRGQPSLNTML
jgi:glycosyltransferase involved in cell wall biosynthesis